MSQNASLSCSHMSQGSAHHKAMGGDQAFRWPHKCHLCRGATCGCPSRWRPFPSDVTGPVLPSLGPLVSADGGHSDFFPCVLSLPLDQTLLGRGACPPAGTGSFNKRTIPCTVKKL